MESYKSNFQGETVALRFIEGHPSPSLTFYEEEEPLGVHIIRSGWSEPQLYHVLTEFGDRMETTYNTLEASQIKEMFSIDVEESFLNTPIVFRKDGIRHLANDMELGKHVRGTINK
jgi:hypothetical protein